MAELTFELADGARIPAVGFGTFEIKEEDAERAVGVALEAGYRHVDTAEGCVPAIRSGCPNPAAEAAMKSQLKLRSKLP